jgi:uncharacterized protein (DUF736 family)
MNEIGRFEEDEDGFDGLIETPTMQLPVRFEKRDKGANYVLRTANGCDIGAAWRKASQYSDGDYLSVRIDGPEFSAPISATMALKADGNGVYWLRWIRRGENGKSNGQPEGRE